MKKFLSLALAICLIIPFSLVLTACMGMGSNFTMGEKVSQDANEIIEDFSIYYSGIYQGWSLSCILYDCIGTYELQLLRQ